MLKQKTNTNVKDEIKKLRLKSVMHNKRNVRKDELI